MQIEYNDDWVLQALEIIGWQICKGAKDPQVAYSIIYVPICAIRKDVKGILTYISQLIFRPN